MAPMTKPDASQPPARSAGNPGLAADSSRQTRLRRVVRRKYHMHVRGTVPSDIRTRVSAIHVSAIHGRANTDREAKSL